MAITFTKYDPVTYADSIATQSTKGTKTLIDAQTAAATASSAALSALQLALNSFDSSLTTLTSGNTSLLTSKATLSDTSMGSATVKPGTTAGSYSFYVQQLASAHQVSYGGLSEASTPDAPSSLAINLGAGSPFTIDLVAAAQGNTTLTPVQIAAAINASAENNGRVTASVVTVGGSAQLVLTAGVTGLSNNITVDTSNVAAGDWKDALENSANFKQLAPNQNAIIYLGNDASGTEINQASNTFTNIDGVSLTFSKVSAAGTSVKIDVATDSGATATNVQNFVDAYNKLKKSLDSMTDAGDPVNSKAAGAFAHDSGVAALKTRMINLLRQNTSGMALANYGITSLRDGSLSLDTARLSSALKTNPSGLDSLIGRSATATSGATGSGIAGAMKTYLAQWTDVSKGQLTQRQDGITKLQKSLDERQTTLQTQFQNVYNSTLLKFTQLQDVQQRMSQASDMFDALFGNEK